MTIRNKDGSIYKLREPNPMMENQDIWKEFTTHNLEWEKEIIADQKEKIVKINSDFKISGFVQELAESKPEIKEPEPIKEPELQVEMPQKPVNLPAHLKTSFIYCLPVIIKTRTDDLYGETYQTEKYEKPFSFEAVIIETTDLFIKLWTTVPNIEINSIIYPKTEEKRWWKINKKEEKSGGWIMLGLPSDFQPSFFGV